MKNRSLESYMIISLAIIMPICSFAEEKEMVSSESKINFVKTIFHYPEAENLVISKIEIAEPKRTKIKYIRTIIKIKEGDEYTYALHEQVYLRLNNAKLFYDIEITPLLNNDYSPQTVTLSIKVTDKWTFLPIPIITYFSDVVGYGITLVESNLFGTGKVLIFHGFYNPLRFRTSAFYIDRHFLGTNLQLFLGSWHIGFTTTDYVYGSASPSMLLSEDNTNVNQIVRKFQGFTSSGSIKGKYRFIDNFSLGLGIEYTRYLSRIVINRNFESMYPLDSAWTLPITLSIEYNTLKPFGSILSKGFFSTINYELSIINSSELYNNGYGQTGYSLGIGKRELHLFSVYASGGYGYNPVIFTELLSGKTFRSMTNNVRATNYVAVALDHTIIVWRNNEFGVIAIYGGDISYYELTSYKEGKNIVFNGGVFISVGLTIKKIAIPLVEVILGMNIPAQYLKVGFAIGGSF